MLGLTGLAAGVLVAQLGWSASAHQPSVLELLIQLLVLVVAIVLVARAVRRPET
ncbi:MAG TPA: hypothetical protein VI172_00280 [Candidatus Dormibacteraeota bacterium]